MKHEFKTIKTENETRYVLETASTGATGAGAVASVSTALGAVRKRNISELETPSGSMFLKFITKQLPDQEQQVYGYAGFGTEPKDVKVANAKIKPFTVDSFDDIEFNIRRILSDKDFVGVEKIIVVPSNSVKPYLNDFENITGERVEIYQGDDDDDEEKIGKSIQHYVIGPDGKKKKVVHTKPKSQMGGRAVEQPKSFTYTLQQRELIPNLRSMGFKIDGDKISLSKQQRDMLLSKLGNDKFGKIFSSGEKFVEDHEIAMASNELMSIIEDAMRLLKLVRKYSEMEGLEAWQQSKITKAADYLNAVLNNLQGDAALNQEDHSNFNNGWGQNSYDTYAGSNHGRGVAEDPYMAELDARLAEKIPANAPVDVYIKDFEKSNAPQFRGKTQEKRKQMALAAYYAKKNPSKKK